MSLFPVVGFGSGSCPFLGELAELPSLSVPSPILSPQASYVINLQPQLMDRIRDGPLTQGESITFYLVRNCDSIIHAPLSSALKLDSPEGHQDSHSSPYAQNGRERCLADGETRCKEESGDEGLYGIIIIDHRRRLYSNSFLHVRACPQAHQHVLPLIFLRYSSILPANFSLS